MAGSGLQSKSIRGGPGRQHRSSRADGRPRCRAVRARRDSIQFLEAQTLTWRLGVDIGGTFTDFALFDESGSEIAVLKRLTTPADPLDCGD